MRLVPCWLCPCDLQENLKMQTQSAPTAVVLRHQIVLDFEVSPVVAVAARVVSHSFFPADARVSLQLHQDTFHFRFFCDGERNGPPHRVPLRKRLLWVWNIVNQTEVFDRRHVQIRTLSELSFTSVINSYRIADTPPWNGQYCVTATTQWKFTMIFRKCRLLGQQETSGATF